MNILDRTKGVEFQKINKVNIIKAKQRPLKNSASFFVIEGGEQDIVKLDFLYEAGSWYQNQPLVASITNAMLREGSTRLSARELSEQLDFYGAYFQPINENNYAGITLYTLNKYLEGSLSLISEMLHTPSFPEAELEILLNKRKQGYTIEMTKVENLARKNFLSSLFGREHPYGQFAELSDYDKITKKQLDSHFKQYYLKSNDFSIIASGKIDDSLSELLDTFFVSDRQANKIKRSKPSLNPSKQKRIHIEKADALQTAIRIGKPTINKLHADFIELDIVNTIIGGYFGSRLMTNLREEKGYTYGIYSVLGSLRESGYFGVMTEVAAEVADASLDEIRKELKKIRTEKISLVELQTVRNFMLGELLRMFDGSFALSTQFKSIYEYGLDYSFYDKYLYHIQNITPNRILELANFYLHEDSMYTVTAGK